MRKITHDRKLATETVQFKQKLRMATIFANFKGVEELVPFHAQIQSNDFNLEVFMLSHKGMFILITFQKK